MAEYIDLVLVQASDNSPDDFLIEIENDKGKSVDIGIHLAKNEEGLRRIRITAEDITKA